MSTARAGLVAEARQAFSYLEEAGANVEFEEHGDRSVLAFIGQIAIFEVEFDWRERAVFLLVCRPFDGRRPPGYYVFHGQRVRLHLLQALIEAGVGDQEARRSLHSSAGASGEDAMRSQISTLASTLGAHLDELNGRIESLFG